MNYPPSANPTLLMTNDFPLWPLHHHDDDLEKVETKQVPCSIANGYCRPESEHAPDDASGDSGNDDWEP